MSVSLQAFPSVASAGLLDGLLGGGAKPAAGPVKPLGGNLRPFYGNLRPFGGNLRPFYGNLRPFWGNLRPFWGETSAFYGDLSTFWAVSNPVQGANAPDYTKVGDFWTTTGGTWDQIFNTWSATSATTGKIQSMLDSSRTFWGASVKAQTGKSFDDAFAKPLLAKYGIDLANPKSLADLDETDRALFFLEFYDGLMNFTGTDHVDHWMKAINWSPALTRTQGGGGDVRIGILDQSINSLASGQVLQFTGTSNFSDGHGDGVASLISGAHDGKGVMGLAPDAKVYAYNPFDASGTANWDDVTDGVRKLKASGASVVNMSLGVPGMTFDPGWNNVFADLQTTLILKNTVFVVAAGNEGATQTKNVNWLPINPSVIIVGSVGLDGEISNFSNRPGEACLSTLGLLCLPGQKLKDRFIVAPGEMILVSDGKGGVVRQNGTSFAAPLVSGAIALLHDRWPWLKNFPAETVNIILESAKDLGAPGTDPIYGRGMLDVEASQSPLDFNSLIWFTVENGQQKAQSASQVLGSYQSGKQTTWDASGAYFYAFEPLGLLTSRDFAIPLSQKLVGQNVTTNNGAREQFQSYLLGRLDDWAASKGKGRFAGSMLNGFSTGEIPLANPWGADLTVSFAPRQARQGFRDEGPTLQSAFKFQGERSAVTFGFGDGAPALTGGATGFAQAGDYDIDRGGANPLLGLASGGGYAGWSYGVGDKVQFSAGAMVRDQERDTRLLRGLGVLGNGAERYEAAAQLLSMSYKPIETLTFTGAYTRLREDRALLGIQSFDPSDFQDGSTTDGYSLSLNWAATAKLSVMATGTVGKTRTNGGQTLSVGKDGLTSTAFQVGVARNDLMSKGDRLQISVSQPMFVERGRLDVSTVQVIDRQTGEIGIATQSIDISGKRRIAGEALYMRPVSGGLGDVALFGRVETQGGGATSESYTTGARFRIAF
ncbi:MAG: S8 family serine peptidase [Alphaproteobacteria bacterium]|nr:S8 family serine peptidase [Alphaproteobacteria bacterium]MBU1513022.1 S8 family serine peptidase [Alphaproteobacteria bacterium]MBU2095130.1 S8 family serine peptidase [Alphaproteobacteria bacterium]MBU2152129.1 S8 family serine peptidase [Alphaproteobacteria bacterium]MBU2306381.1 S8 family serine peptidase [Alphaproteobacteria bacterium]